MNASRIALIPLICILALDLAAGVIDLIATGSNTATGNAIVQGDVFYSEPDLSTNSASLYTGVWAHVYVPTGNDGINSGNSERTAQGRTDTRTGTISGKEYTLTNSYGDTTVIAKASKTGVLGSAEAFSEVSALTAVMALSNADLIEAIGSAKTIAYISHSGTGTANASADGSSDYSSIIDAGKIQAIGSVSGSAALDAANNYGGYVTGAAFKDSISGGYTGEGLSAISQSLEYLSLESGRSSLSAKSTIDGRVSGESTSSGFCEQTENPIKYGSSASSSKGDLSATATTYKLGDFITPSAEGIGLYFLLPTNQLDLQGAEKKGITEPLYHRFLGGEPRASAYLMSLGEAYYYTPSLQNSFKYSWDLALAKSFTSSSVTRTLSDANEAYGASYIDNGALSTETYTSSASGKSPVSLATVDADKIFMGSGAHLVSRLTGIKPASYADLTIQSISSADGIGAVRVSGDFSDTVVKSVGPLYSPGGTSADATGSYLTAANIGGTTVHIADQTFTAPSQLVADDISEINIWSWVAGDDPRIHAESKYGLSPFVSTPVYIADPEEGVSAYTIHKTTSGPTVTPAQDATSRSVSTVFESEIVAIV